MKLEDVMKLVSAGYTKQEIDQMEQTPVQNAELPTTPAEQPEQVKTPVAVPTPTPTPVQTQQEEQPSMADIMKSIAKLTSAVQANAIAQSQIPNGAIPTAPKAEDMIAEIIRPTYKERG